MIKTFRLPNGITCVTEDRPQSGKVSMHISIKSGSADEPVAEGGLTFLMQEACNGGTTTRSREQLAEAAESKGAGLYSQAGRESTIFGTTALTRYAGETFSVLSDMVRNPAFVAAEVKKTQAQIGQWIDQQNEDPESEAAQKFFEAAFSGQSIAADPLGAKKRAASFTAEQVKKKHAELLAHPENIVISFAGDITAAAAEKLVQDHFGDLPAAAVAAKKQPVSFTGGDIRKEADNDQINLALGFKAPTAADPDKYVAQMLREYLSGGMSSPLFQEVREKRGLVYGVYAAYSSVRDTGVFEVVAGAGKGNAGELISTTMDIFGKVIREGISEADLDRCRERIIRGMKGALEEAGASCERNAAQIEDYGRVIPLEEYEARFRNVTSDDIRRVTTAMLKDGQYALSGVGPQETMPSPQEIKEMMQAQVKGVTVPEAKPAAASIAAPFAVSAKKAPEAAAEPKMTVLENGMIVMSVERPGNLSCGAWIGAGSDHETAEENGDRHANEHMVFKGTSSYAPGEIDRIVEGQLGGNLNAYTSKDRTAYYFYDLEAQALAKIVDICGEMVFKAKLDHAEFDGKPLTKPDGSVVKAKGERDVIIEEINIANDKPDDLAEENVLFGTAYPDQPHGRSTLGTEKTLRAMTVQQLIACRDEFYVPNNIVLCAVGPIKHEDLVALAEKKFEKMPAKKFPPLPVPVYKGGTAFVEHKNAALCGITLAAEAPPSADPDSVAYSALALLLGAGASSRLNRKIVMEQQLTAGVTASTTKFRNGGIFCIKTSLEPEKIRPFISSAYAEMRALAATITEAELDKVKAFMEMGLLDGLESNQNACNSYACGVQVHGKVITRDELIEKARKLTVDDVKRVLNKVLSCNPTLAMVVPPGTDRACLPKHEEVIAFRDGTAPPKATPRPTGPVA